MEQLYVIEGLTEGEIAQRYGTYQVKVNRLRKQFGIQTISKSDRYDLPDSLSGRQKMILLGSMFGDGRLFPTGSKTAAYSEYHCEAQQEYLEWKAKEWGPFVTSIRPSVKVENGKEYRGSILRLVGCRHFRWYWETFYPEGSGDKTFVNVTISNLTGLAVAVWYMDDGSKAGSGVRFAVSPRPGDQAILLRLLAKFGIEGHLYDSTGDADIFISGRSNITKFVDLVAPYIPPCMSHKLELFPRAMGVAPRDRLKPEIIISLVSRGVGATEIARTYDVGINTARRAMRRAGIAPGPAHRPKRSTSCRLTVEEAHHTIESTPLNELTEGRVLEVLQRTEFPERNASLETLNRDLELLRACTTRVEGVQVVGMPKAGIVLCDHFFDYRSDAGYESTPSVRQAWCDPAMLSRAIRFQMRVGDPLLPWNVYRALRGVVKTPTNFRPGVAKAVVEAFCPPGGLVLDPCAGYGGRASGTLAAGLQYVGVDPHPRAPEAYQGLFDFIGQGGMFHNAPFEDSDLGVLQADLVFTSPPYFNVERYSDDTGQSWVRYKTWDAWVDQFYRVLLQKGAAHLKSGAYYCLNVADIDGGKYPLVSTALDLAPQFGLHHERTINMPLGRFGTANRSEPILVFRKT